MEELSELNQRIINKFARPNNLDSMQEDKSEIEFRKLEMVHKILKTKDKRIQAKGVVAVVRTNKSSGQKLVTIPRICYIEKGDYVLIKKFKV